MSFSNEELIYKKNNIKRNLDDIKNEDKKEFLNTLLDFFLRIWSDVVI